MKFGMLKEEELEIIIKIKAEVKAKECINCGSLVKRTSKRPYEVVCTWSVCKKRYNLWTGTIFYHTQVPLVNFLRVLEFFMQKSSIKLIAYITLLDNKTVSRVLKKTASILVPRLMARQEKIGGNGMVVEIDESKFGKRKYNRGHRVEGVWILGMIEKTGQKRIRMVTLKDRSKHTLLELIKMHVEQDTIIYTDCWRGYIGLDNYFTAHYTVNHSLHFVDPETGVHTNTIEGSWTGVKLQTPIRLRSKNKITFYLVRYMLLKDTSFHPLLILLNYLFYFFSLRLDF